MIKVPWKIPETFGSSRVALVNITFDVWVLTLSVSRIRSLMVHISLTIKIHKSTEMVRQRKFCMALKGSCCWFLLIRQICIEWNANAQSSATLEKCNWAQSPADECNSDQWGEGCCVAGPAKQLLPPVKLRMLECSSKTQWNPTGYSLCT